MTGVPLAHDAEGPSRILVATDGSAAATVAVDLVADLSLPPDPVIRVIEAIDVGPGLFAGPWPALAMPGPSEELEGSLQSEARREVEDARSRLLREGRSVTAAVESGRPASVIVDEARAVRADLVVIGSRGHGTIASMLLGSVSAEVISQAPASVLVARSPRIERVVLAWDGSPCAMLAVEAVRTWSFLADASIDVVSVADVAVPWWTGFAEVGAAVGSEQVDVIVRTAEAARRAAAELAGDLVATLRSEGRVAVADPRDGDAATELIAVARHTGADLIVMGTHGRTGLARITLGSVASNVTRHAPCSVLVVRASEPAGVAHPT